MKPLLTLFFLVLTVVVYADRYVSAPYQYSEVPVSVVPMTEAIATYASEGIPSSYSLSDSAVTTVSAFESVAEPVLTPLASISPPIPVPPDVNSSFSVAKLAEKPLAVPLPLGPRLPRQNNPPELERPIATIRGQVESVENLKEIMDMPLPPAQGTIDPGTINSKLTESLAASDLNEDMMLNESEQTDSVPTENVKQTSPALSDPLGHTVLLAAMVITTIGLIYMAFVAYDYRQRWMQSLTVQNDRYLSSGMYDMDMDDSFGMRSWELSMRS